MNADIGLSDTSPGSDDAQPEPLFWPVIGGVLTVLLAVVLGVTAIGMGVPVSVVLGVAIALGGIAQAYFAFGYRKWGEVAFALGRGLFYLVAGTALVMYRTAPPYFTPVIVSVVLVLSFRSIRKAATLALLHVVLAVVQRSGSTRAIALLRRVAVGAVKICPPLRFGARRSMQRAGVYRPGLVSSYIERAADQMEFLMRVAQAGFPASGVLERFRFDSSLSHLLDAHAMGHGVLVISPHLCAYPIFPRVLADKVPCSIYLRRSLSTGKHAANMAVGRAGGGDLVYVPYTASPTDHLSVAMRILRKGRALFITPDVTRKSDEGVAVTVFDRTAYFPTGVFVMAMRTQAPIVSAVWHYEQGQYHVRFDEPVMLAATGNRRQRAAQQIRAFARNMDQFLHEHPEMWWNWLDKRWTRILREPGALDKPAAEPAPVG